jgi:hypothetical protein
VVHTTVSAFRLLLLKGRRSCIRNDFSHWPQRSTATTRASMSLLALGTS